ncbi:MAG: riboflavin synthase subunit beta [Maribacter sp.]
MGFLSKFTKLNRAKGFDYQPRYYKSDKEGNPFKMEYKFDQFRTTAGSNRGLKNKFNNILEDSRRQGDRNMRIRLFVIISILIFIFLYIIDFDLSIFFSS